MENCVISIFHTGFRCNHFNVLISMEKHKFVIEFSSIQFPEAPQLNLPSRVVWQDLFSL